MKKVLENQVFDVFFKEVREQERVIPNYLIIAPKRKLDGVRTGVAVLPIYFKNSKEGKQEIEVGLIKIYRHAVEQSLWEIPKGFLDPDESLVDCAKRELAEEMGIENIQEMLSLGSVMPEASLMRAEIMVFAAKIEESELLKAKQFKVTEIGHEKVQFFPLKDALKLAEREITDPCTLAAFLRMRF